MSKSEAGGITRRDFTKAGAAAGFAILAAKSGKAEDTVDTIRVGVIGCGGRGGGAAINCVTGNKNAKIVAMADAFEDKLTAKRNELNKHPQVDVTEEMSFAGIDAYEKLLETDIDMIIHAAPPYARPTHIEAAVKAGKHIFTEKPVAVDPVGIRQFIAAAKEAEKKKLSFVTGTQRRHQKPYVETIEKLRDGAIGEIRSARAYWCGRLPFSHRRRPDWSDLEYRLRNWYNYVWTCGDNIVEQHIHNIDVINWVMGGPPEAVFASGGRAWKQYEEDQERYGDIWDHFSCDYVYENGVRMTSMCRHWNESDGGVFEEVTGTKGVSNCRDMGSEGMDPYVQEHVDLMASITGEGPYLNEGVRTAESTMTAIMGRMSAFTGKKLTFKQAMRSDLSIVPEGLDFSKSYPVPPIAIPGT
jgi:predicted dehydrogenase